MNILFNKKNKEEKTKIQKEGNNIIKKENRENKIFNFSFSSFTC